jgi:hypothetical protein
MNRNAERKRDVLARERPDPLATAKGGSTARAIEKSGMFLELSIPPLRTTAGVVFAEDGTIILK